MYKLAIVGSRKYPKLNQVTRVLDLLKTPIEIVSGGAFGVDTAAILHASKQGRPTKIFLPDWDRHGKGAGMIRNREIVAYVDAALMFWDGESRGTENTIRLAQINHLFFHVVYPDSPDDDLVSVANSFNRLAVS